MINTFPGHSEWTNSLKCTEMFVLPKMEVCEIMRPNMNIYFVYCTKELGLICFVFKRISCGKVNDFRIPPSGLSWTAVPRSIEVDHELIQTYT